MKRTVLFLGATVAVAVAFFLVLGQRPATTPESLIASQADSVWYHASDVALLATTGRPQLVEFFHPN